MAEGIVLNIAKNILDPLTPLAAQTIGELWGIKTELEKLQKTVSTIRSVLLHAEELYYQSSQVKAWVAQLKDALCDAEDLLGEYCIESQLKNLRSQNKMMKEVRTFFSSSNQLVLCFKMVRKLKEVRMKIDDIKGARNFLLDERLVDEVRITAQRRESEHSFIPKSEIIGRDNDKEEIKRLLLKGSGENVSAVSIVGIGGLGKTTLAKYVFSEEDVKKHFELRMWVTVSDDFDIKIIARKIIASAKDADCPEHLEMEQIQSRLRKEIDGKRYLLVLDDLWNENREQWLKLNMLLNGGAKGSKILITTRSPIVAKASGVVAPYVLRELPSGESLNLFMICASSEGQDITESEKVSIGKEIIEKCRGVPLALRVIGGMLYLKKTREEWLFFKDKDLQKIVERDNDKINGIIAVLRISYDHLPSYLKQCFAFCSLFPKDFIIRKSTLTSLWVAQGFIQPSLGGDLDLEQKADDSFMYLLHRGFFQDRDDDDLGNVWSCKMHDLMHDLACKVAGTECDVLGPDRRGSLHSKTLRHLSYPSHKILMDEFPEFQLENMKLRTLLSTRIGNWSDTLLPELTCHKLMSCMKYLRALTLRNTEMVVVPSCLCKLKLLSYLDLSYNDKLERVPKSMKKLQNLMTLILNDCGRLKELPSGIGELVRLTDLHFEYSPIENLPRGLGKLNSLRRLTRFIVREDSFETRNCVKLSELGGLNKLRAELTIRMAGYIKNAAVESERANLRVKQFLDVLRLLFFRWQNTREDNRQNEAEVITNHEALLEGFQPHAKLRKLTIQDYNGTIFPRWIMEDITLCLPNLVEVKFSDCKKCRYLPPLGRLPRLKSLELWDLDEVESIGISIDESSSSNLAAPSPSFPSLSELAIIRCTKLKSMPSIENVELLFFKDVSAELVKQPFRLPRLRGLKISRIENLESLPDWVQHCTALETLYIKYCKDLASLPESMTQQKSLQNLGIEHCSQLLTERCQREIGEDWHKIKHIPHIMIRPTFKAAGSGDDSSVEFSY